MGKYTNWNDPVVDEIVDDHMNQIVEAIRQAVEPQSVFLRGSFSRGEGSVAFEDDRTVFLSDYELMAVTPKYADRGPLNRIASEMTSKLGVETSICRLDPTAFKLGRVPGRTIAHYELREAGLAIFGPDRIQELPPVDPSLLSKWSGVRMLFNRMAESLVHQETDDFWEKEKWAVKTILSCGEALLLVSGRYHYSYKERSQRFTELAADLDMVKRSPEIVTLVQAATEFKLRPSNTVRSSHLSDQWPAIKDAYNTTFRQIIKDFLGMDFGSYADFPGSYRQALSHQSKVSRRFLPILPPVPSQNAYLLLRSVRDGSNLLWSSVLDRRYPAYQVIYASVPALFFGSDRPAVAAARAELNRVIRLPAANPDSELELKQLRASAFRAWKQHCYGLWERI